MKTLTIILSIILFSLTNCLAQVEEGSSAQGKQKLTKEQKQQQKLQREAEQARLIDTLIAMRQWVLEADYINGSGTNRYSVSSNLNFIAIDLTEGIVQLGRIIGTGANGVGGITFEGHVTKYKVVKTVKKKYTNYYISINIFSTLGSYDVSMIVSSYGDASARLSGNKGYIVNYSGYLVPIGVSKVYKGHTLF